LVAVQIGKEFQRAAGFGVGAIVRCSKENAVEIHERAAVLLVPKPAKNPHRGGLQSDSHRDHQR